MILISPSLCKLKHYPNLYDTLLDLVTLLNKDNIIMIYKLILVGSKCI